VFVLVLGVVLVSDLTSPTGSAPISTTLFIGVVGGCHLGDLLLHSRVHPARSARSGAGQEVANSVADEIDHPA